ncbi:unnamed protein product [Haemonchus placei]|uniref:Tudor-knot domain-containing protein n=1 Tax=Haemonchus placei TaxID=6290 RepID=A0A0N4W739_HAEPC|nr:unnamed protein product [Haemonchus placei]
MPPRAIRYEVNDKVLCKHGLFFYEAKITDVEEEAGEMIYTVHYQGWHKRYDERIRQSKCPEMFLPLTDANIAKAKADIQEASAAKSKRKKQKLEDEDARKSENGSRASTPSDRAGIRLLYCSWISNDRCSDELFRIPNLVELET